MRTKARVIYQSTSSRQPLPKATGSLRVVMVGHLRQVKSPQTLFDAARLLPPEMGIQIAHIGEANEPALGELDLQTARDCPHYRWLGALPHETTRRAIQRAHVLVHTSAMEGGAHVIMEAVCSGTPVLASRVDGNVGMLGDDYRGYFEHGDSAHLALLLQQCLTSDLLNGLRKQSTRRAPLFSPETERQAVLHLVEDLRGGA
ncbi:glycosyltransferase [Ramlibacter sp. MAH-25]|uniref:Glycosyltransferase n=2 Tax=Comamonadaceae TaxID=80864 RepID=A0A6N8ISD8_9BURK|nr:glycosyltransferase [Ramlibacter sp. CGMCC 1.13660]MVQ29642.1 glycosyltransferase [Ramlibacter pinisoli]